MRRPSGSAASRHVEAHDRVVELRLVGDAHRSRDVQPRDTHQPTAGQRIEGAHGAGQGGGRVTQVGAQSEVGPHPLLRRGVLRSGTMSPMTGPLVVIFHQSPRDGEPPLTALLARRASSWWRATRCCSSSAPAAAWRVLRSRRTPRSRHEPRSGSDSPGSWRTRRPRRGLVVLGGGAVPLLRDRDATSPRARPPAPGTGVALTNNRYSSDVCAVVRRARAAATCRRSRRTMHCLAGSRSVAGVPRSGAAAAASASRSTSTRPLDLALVAHDPAGASRPAPPRAWHRHPAPRCAASRSPATPAASCWWPVARAPARSAGWSVARRCRVRFADRGARPEGLAARSGRDRRPVASSSAGCWTSRAPTRSAAIVAGARRRRHHRHPRAPGRSPGSPTSAAWPSRGGPLRAPTCCSPTPSRTRGCAR